MKEITSEELVELLEQDTISLSTDIYITDKSKKKQLKENWIGTLDGNGHTIYNISSQLFKEISEQGVIKNLTIVDADTEKSTICETNFGTIENVDLKNCYIETPFSRGRIDKRELDEGVMGRNFNLHIGSFVGTNSGTIDNCEATDIKICSTDEVGGIAHKNNSIIKNCTLSEGDVKGIELVGGIVSRNETNGTIDSCNIIESSIKGTKTIGGIVATTELKGKLRGCNVIDSIVGETQSSNIVGGICGFVKKSSMQAIVKNVQVINSTVQGDKTIGGIAGKSRSIFSESYVIDGEVTGQEKIGGIVGKNYEKISEIQFEGTVNGEKLVGAITGEDGRSKITFEGSVTGEKIV